MINYSYRKELNINPVTFREFDLDDIREVFAKIFESYNPKVKDQVFDSFCEDFYNLTTQIHATSEKIWRMVITDMLFCYEDKGYLEGAAKDSGVKRKQFAIIANVLIGKLRVK